MWSAVIVVKEITTGKEIKRISGIYASSRRDLENSIFDLASKEINSKKEYYTANISSPIGFFNSDPTGWDLINFQKRGLLG